MKYKNMKVKTQLKIHRIFTPYYLKLGKKYSILQIFKIITF